MDVVAVGPQAHYGIADQLAGTVVGDPAAAVGVDNVDALPPIPVLAHRQLISGRAAPLRVDGRVLEQQQHVGDAAVVAGAPDLPLQPARVLVWDEPEADSPDFVHGHSVSHAAVRSSRASARRSRAIARAASRGVTDSSAEAAKMPSRLPSIPRASSRACSSL